MRWFAVLGARQRKTPPRKGRGPSAEYLARRDGLVPCSGSETHGENFVLLTLKLNWSRTPESTMQMGSRLSFLCSSKHARSTYTARHPRPLRAIFTSQRTQTT